MIHHLLFIYFQVDTGVLYLLDYVEDIYIMVLSVLVSIVNPNHMYSPLLLTVYYGRSTPVAQLAPRNLLTRWDVSSIPANGIFLTKN